MARRNSNAAARTLSLILVAVILGASLLMLIRSGLLSDPAEPDASSSGSQASQDTSGGGEPVTSQEDPDNPSGADSGIDLSLYSTTVLMSPEELHSGLLILVNNSTPFVFPNEDDSDAVTVYSIKNRAYKVSSSSLSVAAIAGEALNRMMTDFQAATGKGDINVISGIRTYDDQQRLYDARVESSGVEEASKWIAKPGCSEHHTGLAVDFGIYTDDDVAMDFTGEDEYAWINNNCRKYGFILRYTDAKKSRTGINDEPWHFRYVGLPHATLIEQNSFCLEEYIDYLKRFVFGEKHLYYTDSDGQEYEIYYVPAASGDTEVRVPAGADYTVSGNNTDGFIVTVSR